MGFVCRKLFSVGGLRQQLNCHTVGMGPVVWWDMEQGLSLVPLSHAGAGESHNFHRDVNEWPPAMEFPQHQWLATDQLPVGKLMVTNE